MSDNDTADIPKTERPSTAAGEISLTEILLILLKRRVLVVSIAGLCTLAGLAIGSMREHRYDVSLAVEIGRAGADETAIIESPTDVVTKLRESHIPKLLSENPDLVGLKFVAEVPGGTRIVKVSAKAPTPKTAEVSSILGQIAAAIVKDHEGTVTAYRHQLEARIEQLDLQTKTLIAELKGLETERFALQRTLTKSTGVDAVSIGLAHVEVERIIAGTRAALAQVLHDLHSAQDQALTIQSSRAVTSAVVSTQPIGAGIGVIALVSLLAGVIIGIVTALITEFVAGATRHLTRAVEGR